MAIEPIADAHCPKCGSADVVCAGGEHRCEDCGYDGKKEAMESVDKNGPMPESARRVIRHLATRLDAAEKAAKAATELVRVKSCVTAQHDANHRRCRDWMPEAEWCAWCRALDALGAWRSLREEAGDA